MKNLQKLGGVSALYMAAAYVVTMVGVLLILDISSVVDPVEKVALMLENQTFLSTLHLISYVFWGFFLIVLALALYERLKAGSPAMAMTAAAIGLIWAGLVIASGTIHNVGMGIVVDLYAEDPAQAATVWLAIDAVFEGLSGIEILGGTWTLLVSWAALRAGEFPRALNYLGLVIGVAGILSIVPALAEILIYIFALGQIVWFIWLGILMLRSSPSGAAEEPDTFVPSHSTTS